MTEERDADAKITEKGIAVIEALHRPRTAAEFDALPIRSPKGGGVFRRPGQICWSDGDEDEAGDLARPWPGSDDTR